MTTGVEEAGRTPSAPLEPPAAPASDAHALEGPDWVADIAREPWVERTRSLLRALSTFAIRPAAFARAWATSQGGRESFPNPFFAMAAGVSLLTPVNQELARVLDEGSKTLLWSVAASAGPFAYYVALGALVHVLLRRRGRPKLRGSIAMALYTGGGPGAATSLMVDGIFFGIHGLYGAPAILEPSVPVGVQRASIVVVVALYAWLVWTFSASLAALHGRRAPVAAAALLLAIVVMGIILGALETAGLPIRIGFHFSMYIEHAARWRAYGAITL